MRIKQLDLIKYGKFDGESLAFRKAEHDFHVIVGPNEAGKSTVRNAVLELLFGMPTRTPLAFMHELTELRLGGVLEGRDGETIFHRARGRTQLRTPTDEKLPDDYLASLLGGASKEFFEQMFGLDHERLIEGGRSILDASKDLGRVLFQSASGVGSLGPVRDALEARADELWAKRGGKHEYAQAEARLNEASAELKQTQVRTRVWADAKAESEKVDADIAETKKEWLRLETLRSTLERIRRLAPMLRDLKSKEAELAQLGDVMDMPTSAYADLIKGQADLAGAMRVLAERHKDLDARQREREDITTDDDVLALADDIEALHEARGACLNHPRDLPIRQAEMERLLAEAFAAAAQLGWPAEEQALRATLPSALALKTVTHLLHDHAVLHQATVNAQESVAEKQQDLQVLREQLAGLTALETPDALRQALSDAQALKNSRTKQQLLKTDLAEAARRFEAALTALGRWRNPADILRAMNPPAAVRISVFARQQQECTAAVKSTRDRLEEAVAKLARLQLDEKHFTEGHKVVTHTEVLDARTGRDAAWNEIKKGAVAIDAGASTFDAAIRLADELVDAELGTATEAATLQALRQQTELARAEVSRIQEALTAREAERAQQQSAWEALMNSVPLPEMTLEDLPEWLNKREAVFAAEENLRQYKRDLEIEETIYNDARVKLVAALKIVGLDVVDTDDLASLTSTAANFVRRADAALAQQENFEQQVTQGERILNTLKAKQTSATKAYEDWEAQWQQALLAARLVAASATLAQAAGAVDLANVVADKLSAAEEIRRSRIETMQADLDALESGARRVCNLLDETLSRSSDWPEVIRHLAARLRVANSNAQAAQLADDALREARARKDEAELKVADAAARIQPLLTLAGVETVDKALPLAERSDKRRALQAAIEQAASALTKDGDGLPRNAIEAEVAEQDPVAVIGMLEQTKRELATVSDQQNALAQQQLTAQQTFDAINGAANAATAEAKRQEALAAMGDVAEQFLEIATAKRLLKWAIDRYRDQKQGPMLQRAGEIFSQLTLDQFTRLVVDHETNPPALFARRQNGKQVDVSGLSEGTRDQLFLALRIAALELHLQYAIALPFIADDLFVNFDDGRAKAGLEALRELSKHTQVIFLTHHEHLLPLVRAVFGSSVNIVALKREIEAA